MYNFDYDVCAIFVIAVILLLCAVKRSINNNQFIIFVMMCGLLAIATTCDLISAVVSNNENGNKILIAVANYIFFITHNVIPVLFCIYNVEMTAKIYKRRKWIGILFFVPVVVEFIMILTNPFTKWVFSVESGKGYVRGPFISVLYLASFSYILFTLIYIVVYRKIVGKYRTACVSLYLFITIIPVLVQVYYPHLLVQCFGEVVCFMFVYISIHRQEGIFDSNLLCYNKDEFMNTGKLYFNSGVQFYIISVSIDDVNYMEKMFGIDTMSKLEKDFSIYLNDKIIGTSLKKGSTLYHISEYQFYILVNGIDDHIVRDISDEICSECDRNWIVGDMEIPIDTDVCLIKCPEDVYNIDQLFDCTEYIANEEHGRQSRVIYASDINSFYGKRKSQIKHAVHKAVRNNTFQVYYQPIYSTSKEKVISAEALVRLFDDDMGFISPEEFIPIAEEDGSILKIGNFVLESVCQFIKNNNIEKYGIEYIEVNVSVIECMKQDMTKRVAEVISKYDLRPGQINLEITETAAVNSPQQLGINMNQLVNHGVNFSLDDYGSGHSNINYLIELPFNLIKVDKNIVWSSFDNAKAGIALSSSVEMIRKLGFSIVAEGIETKKQADKLKEMGCEYLQGYYYSKPLPAKEFLQYIRKNCTC